MPKPFTIYQSAEMPPVILCLNNPPLSRKGQQKSYKIKIINCRKVWAQHHTGGSITIVVSAFPIRFGLQTQVVNKWYL